MEPDSIELLTTAAGKETTNHGLLSAKERARDNDTLNH
jgi:hypothetical protein